MPKYAEIQFSIHAKNLSDWSVMVGSIRLFVSPSFLSKSSLVCASWFERTCHFSEIGAIVFQVVACSNWPRCRCHLLFCGRTLQQHRGEWNNNNRRGKCLLWQALRWEAGADRLAPSKILDGKTILLIENMFFRPLTVVLDLGHILDALLFSTANHSAFLRTPYYHAAGGQRLAGKTSWLCWLVHWKWAPHTRFQRTQSGSGTCI